MISSALEFIHARKWLVELILVAVVVAGLWWFCHHLIQVGVQRQRDDDARELVKLQHDADVESGRLQGIADAAHKAQEQEHADNLDYRRTHPLHGGLCLNQGRSHLPEAGATDASHAGTGTAAGDLLALPAGDPQLGGHGEPDIRHLLDVLNGKADDVSATLREYQSR